MKTDPKATLITLAIGLISCAVFNQQAHATGFSLGDAANYGLIFQGGGGNALNINAGPALVSGMAVNGNVGIAGTGTFEPSGGGGVKLVSGNVDFSGTANSFSSSYVGGSVHSGVAVVQTAMNYLNSLSVSLGAEVGTSVALNSGAAINVSAGTLDATGNKVFTVSGINAPNGVLTINGDGTHNVVFNISAAADGNFHFNQIVLTGGLTSDNVLFNFFGGNPGTLDGGPGLNINTGGGSPSHPDYIIYGTFLDPFGDINISDSQLYGRVFGGDSHNWQLVSGAYINQPEGQVVPDAGSALALLSIGLAFIAGAKRKFLRS
jgi:hypothetical protein